MIFCRKIYDKLLQRKENSAGEKALMIEGARRIGEVYIIQTKNLIQKNNVICIPAYMTFCL